MQFIALFALFLAILSSVVARPIPRSQCQPRSAAPSGSVTSIPTSTVSDAPKQTFIASTSSEAKSTTASSSATPSSTSLPSSSDATSSDLGGLFPLGSSSPSWTTSTESSDALSLSDDTLRPTRVESGLTHTYMDAPDGKLSMRVQYPQGSVALSGADGPAGGVSFYAPGPESVDLTTAKEATFGYSVMFDDGFAFNMGGKLPGLYGGDTDDDAVNCSGGRLTPVCFSARLMWRTNGAGELYTYLPPHTEPQFAANDATCNVPPYSTCDGDYGASVGRGAFSFTPGQRTTVSQRVRLNDDGQANGEIQVFVGGQSVIDLKNVILRQNGDGRIRGIQMQSFFGGHTEEWSSPHSQNSWFSDFTVAITETL